MQNKNSQSSLGKIESKKNQNALNANENAIAKKQKEKTQWDPLYQSKKAKRNDKSLDYS
jgi:hypothetical protein